MTSPSPLKDLLDDPRAVDRVHHRLPHLLVLQVRPLHVERQEVQTRTGNGGDDDVWQGLDALDLGHRESHQVELASLDLGRTDVDGEDAEVEVLNLGRPADVVGVALKFEVLVRLVLHKFIGAGRDVGSEREGVGL
jgi:hypothetical protein